MEEGITKCPQCGVSLVRPGSTIQALGWVIVCISPIPLSVGAVVAQQKDFIALGIGIAVLVAGLILVGIGRAKSRTAADPTRPSPAPAGPQASGGAPAR